MQDVLDVVKVQTRHQAPFAVVTLEDLHGRFLGDQSTTGGAKVNQLCNCVCVWRGVEWWEGELSNLIPEKTLTSSSWSKVKRKLFSMVMKTRMCSLLEEMEPNMPASFSRLCSRG